MSTSNSQYSVTFCITELDVGGAEKALVKIAIGLKDLGWDVQVISLRDAGPMTAKLEQSGICVTALDCGGFGDLRSYFRLKKAVLAHRPDILMCFLHQANIYGRLVAQRLRIPAVSGIRVADRRKWVAWTERVTKSCVTHYIAVSEHVAKTHAGLCGIAETRISAIPNGVDLPAETDSTNPEAGPVAATNRLLFVGRLTAQKAPLHLLEAFNALPVDLRESSSLTIVGEGELGKQLEARIQGLGLGARVSMLGQHPDPTELMRQSTLLVLPSLWEGMPNVVLEAMANGLPVVATDVDGTRELITHNKNGWLVPAGQPRQLCAAIQDALRNEDQRNNFAAASQRLAVERFSWNQVIEAYQDRLSRIVGETRR